MNIDISHITDRTVCYSRVCLKALSLDPTIIEVKLPGMYFLCDNFFFYSSRQRRNRASDSTLLSIFGAKSWHSSFFAFFRNRRAVLSRFLEYTDRLIDRHKFTLSSASTHQALIKPERYAAAHVVRA